MFPLIVNVGSRMLFVSLRTVMATNRHVVNISSVHVSLRDECVAVHKQNSPSGDHCSVVSVRCLCVFVQRLVWFAPRVMSSMG